MGDDTRMVATSMVSTGLLALFDESDENRRAIITRNEAHRERLYNRTMEQNETLIRCSGVDDEMQSEALDRIVTSKSRYEILDTVQATLNNDTDLLHSQRDASDVSDDEDEGDVMFYTEEPEEPDQPEEEHPGDGGNNCTTLIIYSDTVLQTPIEPRDSFMSTIDLEQEPGGELFTDTYDVVDEFLNKRLSDDVYVSVLDDYNKMAALEFWCNHKDDAEMMENTVGVAHCDEACFMDLWKGKVALSLDEFLEFMEDDENQDQDAYTWLETAIFKARKQERVELAPNPEFKHPPESAFVHRKSAPSKCMKDIVNGCMLNIPKPTEFTMYMDKNTIRFRSTRDKYKRVQLGTVCGLSGTIDKAIGRLRTPNLKDKNSELGRAILRYCDSLADELRIYKENQ